MNDILFNKINDLKIALENDERVIKLKELDSELDQNEEVMTLSYKKDVALTKYEDASKYFGETSKEAMEAQKALADAKYNLDIHPLVKQYNEAYKTVRLLYEDINNELFYIFKTKPNCK